MNEAWKPRSGFKRFTLRYFLSHLFAAVERAQFLQIVTRCPRRRSALKDLINSTAGAATEPARTFRTPDGYVRFLSTPAAAHFVIAAGTAEEQAAAFLATWRNLFVNESAAVAFEEKRVKTANGRTYIRYRQTYGGLEALQAENQVLKAEIATLKAQ